MKKRLTDLLYSNQPIAEHEFHLRYKIDFLNSVFLFAAIVAFGMGFYRWQFSPIVGVSDFGFAAINVALLFYLKQHREKVEVVSTLALLLCFLLFSALYLLAPYNPMRMSLFFLLTAAAFYLKGRKSGFGWLLLILITLAVGHWLPGFDTGYSHVDLITSCIYLIALFFIFWNYEAVREQQSWREQDRELQSRIDERWRLALEGIGDAVWDWNLQTRILSYSKSYAEMLGYSEDEIGHRADFVATLLHPRDKESAMAGFQSYLSGEFAGQYVSEQRLRCRDGSYKWILCRGRVVQRDGAGRPLRMLGTHTDTTERKLMEQALRENNEHLRSIFENIPTIAVQGYTRDGTILYWNPASERVYGYSREEAMGGNLFDLIIPEQMREQIFQEIQEFAQSGIGTPAEELLLRRKDGTPVSVYSSSVVVRLPGQEAILYCLDVDLSERKEHERQLEHIAHYDALTGVPNRVLLADRLAQALARTKRDKGLMAVCYLDLDGFKPVNDNYGHEAGDRVLVEITRRIKEVIREDDTVARLGGDEFVVLLVGMALPEECVGSLNRLLGAIHQPIEVTPGNMISVSVSIGVALYPEDDHDADTLLRHADQAMYVAKQSGKNRYHLFDAANDLRARSHHALLQQLRHGLVNGEFALYYQPKVTLSTGQLAGVEALIRWHHPQRGLLLPGEFMRMVENTELEIVLGEWVISSALEQMRQWRHAGIKIDVSINISAYHLQSADFVSKLQDQMQHCCAQPCAHCLQIEVLETAALEDIPRVSAIIKACRAFGVSFALDDFGTGYSSLTYLSQLDVDTLKIDQSFVRDMLEEKGEHAIVLGIIALAHAFERSIVAEGVETEAHYQALLAIGCEVGQGNGIARPMPADELINWRESRLG